MEELDRGRTRRNWRENINIGEYLLGEPRMKRISAKMDEKRNFSKLTVGAIRNSVLGGKNAFRIRS